MDQPLPRTKNKLTRTVQVPVNEISVSFSLKHIRELLLEKYVGSAVGPEKIALPSSAKIRVEKRGLNIKISGVELFWDEAIPTDEELGEEEPDLDEDYGDIT